MTNTLEQEKLLENLLLSEDLEELSNLADEFNIFNTLNLNDNEIRHSNFLGWLLNPYETHKLGDYFLKEILKLALKEHSGNENVKASLSDVIFNDFSDTEITLEKPTNEKRRIDILIDSPQNKFVCVIENKIWSGEGCNQLEDYEKFINEKSKYKDYNYKVFIFLTPSTKYDKCKLHKNYIRMDYGEICIAIEKLLKFKSSSINQEVKTFIEHYKKMLERNIMRKDDKEIIELCSKIYKKHEKAIDLIIKKGNPKVCTLSTLEEILNKRGDLADISVESDGIICLPNNIENDKLKFGSWTNDNIIYLHFLCYAYGLKGLFLEILVGPAKDESTLNKRKNLIEYLEEKMEIKFDHKEKEWSETRPLVELLTHEEYLKCKDCKEVKQKIEENLNKYKDKFIDNFREKLNSWN